MSASTEALNPGSYKSYLDQNQSAHGQEAIQGYSDRLGEYRTGRAILLGITPSELHLLPQQSDSPLEIPATQ